MAEDTVMQFIPPGFWHVFLFEMKKYKAFRAGYKSGQKNGLQSVLLHPQSTYRSKIGVLTACMESGLVDDFRIDRDMQVVEGLKNGKSIYLHIGKRDVGTGG